MRKILFISHYFPPIGGAGVQRSAKMVKHLPSLGYLPLVLTEQPKSSNRWTPVDQSLVADISAEVPIFRAEPDVTTARSAAERAGRRHHALVKLGSQIIENEKPELIFVTMSPFADASVASELSRRYRLPWVADLRDPWALDEFQVYRSRWHRVLEQRKMGRALQSAALVIMNTPAAAARFQSAFPGFASGAITSITNGYDASDFNPDVEPRRSEHFTIVHSGYFHADVGLRQRRRALEYRLLGRTEAEVEFLPRSHFFLIQALEKWLTAEPKITSKVRVICVGSPTEVDQRLVQQSSIASLFEFTGYLPHEDCLKYVRGADLLFLPMHKMPAGRRATIVPGKTYEYMAAGRPILAAAPEGDAKEFVKRAGTGVTCEPDDIGAMTAALRSCYRTWENKTTPLQPNSAWISQFERHKLAASLASAFDRLLMTQCP